MSVRRLRHGEWLAALGGVALLASLFLGWYGVRARTETFSGFAALSVVDLLLALLALLAIALAVLQATQTGPALPLGAAVLTVTLGLAGILLVLFRLIDQPGPNEFIEVRAGAWAGLAATVALTAGGWLSLRDERAPHLPPGPEPELRPAP